jgi:hypothetical protein
MLERVRTYATRFSHTARRCSDVIPSFRGAVFVRGGGGRTSEKGFEGALPEAGMIEVPTEGLGVVDVVAPDAMGLSTTVPLGGLAGTTAFAFWDARSPGGIGGLKTPLGGGSGWRSGWGRLEGE